MARAKYFRAKGDKAITGLNKGQQFVDYFVGSEEPKESTDYPGTSYYPRGYMSVTHTPLRYSATFSNDSTDPTGLSQDYLNHLDTENDDAFSVNWDPDDYPHPEYHNYLESKEKLDVAKRVSASQSTVNEYQKEHDVSLKRFARSKGANPDKLFIEHPARTQITGAFFDPSMTAHAPLMGALIHKDFGGEITADEDLSVHSSRFVEKAQKLGLPVKTHPQNPNAEVTNSITLHELGDNEPISSRTHAGLFRPFNEVPESEIKEARQNLKGMLRNKKTHMSAQFGQVEHPKLPGIE